MIKPKVAAVITTYNRFDYLLNAIDSVLSQEYENLEIIIINDDSDDSRYYDHAFPDNVKIIHVDRKQTPEWGGARNPLRNIGAEISDAKYLAFLDDDDIWLSNKLNSQIQELENSEYKMSSTEGYYGEGVFSDNKNYLLYNSERWFKFIKKKYRGTKYFNKNKFPKIWDLEFLKIHNCMILSSVVVERELFIKLGGFRGLPKQGDYDCWLGLLEITSSIYIDEPLFYYDNSHGDGRNYSK